jgi:hypothetical protein
MQEYFRSGAPDVSVLVADEVVLVGMVTMLNGGTRGGSVRVSEDKWWRRGRTIFLIIEVFRFL